MENSKIEWTHHTFNPWIGCTKVSPGCLHCYAETLMDTRYGRVKWGKGQPRSRTAAENWKKPQQWDKWTGPLTCESCGKEFAPMMRRAFSDETICIPGCGGRIREHRQRVFCASLADWLDDDVPVEWLSDLLYLIIKCRNLDWLLLTKRPQLWRTRLQEVANHSDLGAMIAAHWLEGNAPPNVWIGTSAEDQTRWDERMPLLMDIPARVRFVSAEPLLSGIYMGDLRPDWLIIGGESGQGARPMKREWVEHLSDQCDERTAFHFKQWGGVDKKAAGRLLNGRTWDELPSGNDHVDPTRGPGK